MIANVLFNQIIVGLPFAYLSLHLLKWRGLQPIRELPTFHWVLFEMAILILVEEIGFYYSHRYLYLYVSLAVCCKAMEKIDHVDVKTFQWELVSRSAKIPANHLSAF